MSEILNHPNFAQIDFEIILILGIDMQSGLPYSADTLDIYTVPEQFRNLVLKRGTHWHPYINNFIPNLGPGLVRTFGPDGSRPVSALIDVYPSWKFVSDNLGKHPDTSWDETAHKLLHAALIWFQSKEIFAVRWYFVNPISSR
jgi:hypothetical protein